MRTKTCLNVFLKGIICFVLPSLAAGQDNNTNGDNVDMRFVRFNMFVDPTLSATDPKVLNGAVTHYFITKVPNVSTIKFDFYRDNTASSLRLIGDSIRYHGIKYNLAAADHVNDTLLINLPAAIPASGTLDSVTIYYHGNPPQSSGSRGYKRTVTSGTSGSPIISTHSSGFFARQWWPCKHNMTDKIDDGVEFYITAPSTYNAVANGLLQDANPPIVNSTRTWHWKSNYPIAHYLIAMAVSKFTVYTSPSANVSGTTVPIISYLTPAANTVTTKNNIDAMKNVIEHFSTLFGDYPWKNEKYGHVAYTFSGGMENQTASYIGETVFSDISTLAHELAHQWFGDKVTCSKWNHNWVNEGFARYAEILYSEKFETSSAVISKRASYKSGSSVQSSSNTIYRYDVEVVNDNTDHTGKIFVSSMVYNKASIVVSMLRKLVGDANFFQALKNYLNDPLVSFGYAATEDVRRHFEAVSGKDLTAFFDDFIYKAGYPTYNVQWEYSSSLKKVAIKLNQTKTVSGAYAVSGRFHTVLPIRLMKTTAPVKDTTIIIYDDGIQSLNTMGFNVSFAVDQVQVDPDSESYSYSNTVTKTAGLATILPVDLYKFEARRSGDNVTLTWKSGNEVNFSNYEIEHSTDGVAFSKIGRVEHNPSYSRYQFVHRVPAAGRNYYRLKMIDLDGTYKFSSTAVVEIGFEQKVKVAPNPANDKITVLLPYPVIGQTIPVKLINLQEQVFQAVAAKTGSNSIELNVSNIPSGSYWIECTINNYKTVVRVLIQH